jgi:hypothetical protein
MSNLLKITENAFYKYQPMAELSDIIFEGFLLSNFKRNTSSAIEIGSGSAGWPLTMYDLGFNSPSWDLVENFSWASDNIKGKWPTSPSELEVYIRNSNPNFKLNEIHAWVPNTSAQYDLCRIDCYVDPSWAEEFVSNCLTDDAWLFIDDCKMNCGFERIMLANRLVDEGIVHPLWLGGKECLYTKKRVDVQPIVDMWTKLHSPDRKSLKVYPRIESYQAAEHKIPEIYIATTPFAISPEADN